MVCSQLQVLVLIQIQLVHSNAAAQETVLLTSQGKVLLHKQGGENTKTRNRNCNAYYKKKKTNNLQQSATGLKMKRMPHDCTGYSRKIHRTCCLWEE